MIAAVLSSCSAARRASDEGLWCCLRISMAFETRVRCMWAPAKNPLSKNFACVRRFRSDLCQAGSACRIWCLATLRKKGLEHKAGDNQKQCHTQVSPYKGLKCSWGGKPRRKKPVYAAAVRRRSKAQRCQGATVLRARLLVPRRGGINVHTRVSRRRRGPLRETALRLDLKRL